MPPSERESTEGWIASDQMARIPRQDLVPQEAEAFLAYLFTAIGRRPKSVELRKGAAVARYLKWLAWETAPGPQRLLLERLSEVIWGTVLQFGRFSISRRDEAMEFLEEHAGTYLVAFDVEAAVKQVRDSTAPARHTQGLPPPNLQSRSLSVQGTETPHRKDDVSERIFAAYYALRRAGVRGARGRVAAALNQQGLQTRARGATLRVWGPYEVYERVKQYRDGWKQQNPSSDDFALKRWRDALVNRWLYLFHTEQDHGTRNH
jgi:hypothetical protein